MTLPCAQCRRSYIRLKRGAEDDPYFVGFLRLMRRVFLAERHFHIHSV